MASLGGPEQQPGAESPLAVGSALTGDSAPSVLHTLQPTSTHAWLFIAGAGVDLDQVEDNRVIFRFISQLVKGNRLCWLRQALPSLSRHSQVLGQVTPMLGLQKGHTPGTMRAQRMQQKRLWCTGLHQATLPAIFIQEQQHRDPTAPESQSQKLHVCAPQAPPSLLPGWAGAQGDPVPPSMAIPSLGQDAGPAHISGKAVPNQELQLGNIQLPKEFL